ERDRDQHGLDVLPLEHAPVIRVALGVRIVPAVRNLETLLEVGRVDITDGDEPQEAGIGILHQHAPLTAGSDDRGAYRLRAGRLPDEGPGRRQRCNRLHEVAPAELSFLFGHNVTFLSYPLDSSTTAISGGRRARRRPSSMSRPEILPVSKATLSASA